MKDEDEESADSGTFWERSHDFARKAQDREVREAEEREAKRKKDAFWAALTRLALIPLAIVIVGMIYSCTAARQRPDKPVPRDPVLQQSDPIPRTFEPRAQM